VGKVEKYRQSEGLFIERRVNNCVKKNQLDAQIILCIIFMSVPHINGD